MPSRVALGWKTGVITDVRDFKSGTGNRFIRISVLVSDGSAKFKASALCRPSIVPGGDLYKWIRVCGIRLAEIDSSIRPQLFIGKSAKVNLVQNGDYYNIVDCKEVGG